MKYKVVISHQVPHGEGDGFTLELQAVAEDGTVISQDTLQFDSKEELQAFKESVVETTKAYL